MRKRCERGTRHIERHRATDRERQRRESMVLGVEFAAARNAGLDSGGLEEILKKSVLNSQKVSNIPKVYLLC